MMNSEELAVLHSDKSSPRQDSEIIDEAIDESFPASDPPAHTPVTSSGAHESAPDPHLRQHAQASPVMHLRIRLIEMQERLDAESAAVEEGLHELIQPPGQVSDLPTHNADHDVEGLDVALETAQVQSDLRQSIAAALQRMDEGRYGDCETCGKEIPPERLEAVPYASHCVECQVALEREGTADR